MRVPGDERTSGRSTTDDQSVVKVAEGARMDL